MAKKSGGGATAPKPVVKPAPKVAPKAATPAKTPTKAPVKVYSSPPKPTSPKPIQSPASAARTMSSPKPAASAPVSTAGSKAASSMTSTAAKTAGKKVAETAAKTAGKTVLKTLAKRIPYVGGLIAVGDIAYQAYDAYKNSTDNKKTEVKANAPKPASSAPKPSTSVKRNDGLADYMKTVDSTSPKKTTVEKPKGSSSTGGSKGSGSSSAPKSAGSTSPAKTETKSETKPKSGIRMSASKLPVSAKQLDKSKPVNVSYKRTYSDTEKKMQEVMAKGKQADSTMSESAQAKLKALQAKRRMASQKSEKDKSKEAKKATGRSEDYIKSTMKGIRKEGKVSKRAAVKTAKANLKATRKS